jgi:hypothetical protein
MIRENRLAKLESQAGPEREALLYNRRIMLSAIPELMTKLGVTEAEARLLFALCNPPEVAVLIADDWETNPRALDLLKTLREPNGNRKIMEAGLERGARAFGLSFEDALALVCLNPDVSIETKLELARIAKARGMDGVLLLFAQLEAI